MLCGPGPEFPLIIWHVWESNEIFMVYKSAQNNRKQIYIQKPTEKNSEYLFVCWFRSHSKYLYCGTLSDFHPIDRGSRALRHRQTKYVCRNRRHIGTYGRYTEPDPIVAIYLKQYEGKKKDENNEYKIMKTPRLLCHWTIQKWIQEKWLMWIRLDYSRFVYAQKMLKP